jgi:hypothetical protein
MKFFKLLFVLLLTIVISGCGGTSPSPVKKKAPIPQWVNSVPPSDTATTMYGLAVGKNREAAIKAALSDMISHVGVSIESSFEQNEKLQYNRLSSVTKSQIKSEISKVKINNYKVLKSYKISYNEFAVMIETDKMKFVKGLKDELQKKKNSIKNNLDNVASQDRITRYNVKKELTKEAKSMIPLVLMIGSLDGSYDKNKDLDFVVNVEQSFLKESNSLRFFVSGNRDAQAFVSRVKHYLTQEGFHLSNTKRKSIQLRLTCKTNISKNQVKIVVFMIESNVYDGKKNVGGATTIVKERYTTKASLFKNAAIHFEQEIEEKGLKEVLGINLNVDTND